MVFRFLATDCRFRRLEVMPTLSGSTLTIALSASWKLSGWSETGLAFGINPHLWNQFRLLRHFTCRTATDALAWIVFSINTDMSVRWLLRRDDTTRIAHILNFNTDYSRSCLIGGENISNGSLICAKGRNFCTSESSIGENWITSAITIRIHGCKGRWKPCC